MSIHEEVNLIIFRIPDEDPENKEHEWDDGFRLVELPYLGQKLAEAGTIFLPHIDDESYRSIEFDRIVLARTIAEGSLELTRYQLIPEKKGDPEKVCEMDYNELSKTVEHLVGEYDAERAGREPEAP
jgi:hypothetical protein